VYNEATGVQKCRHHDVCDADFLKWQGDRLQYLKENVEPRIPKSARPYYEDMEGLKQECLKRCSNDSERNVVEKKKSIAQLEKRLRADGRTRGKQHICTSFCFTFTEFCGHCYLTEGCDLSCNLHTGVRICLLSVVEEDLRLRNVAHSLMTSNEKRQTLELLLREEEEFLKLQMYLRDDRFRDLDKNAGHRGELHKTVLDMLHCPMRTNEKVLTMLYEEVLQGSHKAEATAVLRELTAIIRRLGEIGELWTHKFAENSTKALMKFKLPYDQSRKIFAVHQLPALREAVYIAIPPSDHLKRNDWMSFLDEYVHMNALLHRTDEYKTADVDLLEQHMDAVFKLLVTKIGGAERGVTNYFHYIGS
jgi:hypothetical protein